MKIVKISNLENPLNGRTKQSARNYIYKLVGNLTQGLFRDNDWRNVNAIWSAIDNAGIERYTTNTYYKKDEQSGELASKTWHFEIPFINKRGNEDKMLGTLNAHFAGSVQDPTESYDISFII